MESSGLRRAPSKANRNPPPLNSIPGDANALSPFPEALLPVSRTGWAEVIKGLPSAGLWEVHIISHFFSMWIFRDFVLPLRGINLGLQKHFLLREVSSSPIQPALVADTE